MASELHLFIIWEKARSYENQIIEMINENLQIVKTYNITWSPYLVSRNFTRFYGQKLPSNSEKELHCGKGEFKLIVVQDIAPKYDLRKTSVGLESVNVKMFDTKVKLRKITGGGHKVHGTNDTKETKHDLFLLLGITVDEFLESTITESLEEIHLKQDLLGAEGWESFEQLFYVLNELTEYVVLRNVENIDLGYFKQNSGDVDILTADKAEFIYLLGGFVNLGGHCEVSVSKQIILFEVYERNKNLICEKFEENLFFTKTKKNIIYSLSDVNNLYMLVYHSVIFNESLQSKHLHRLTKLADSLDVLKGTELTKEKLLNVLDEFMLKNGYFYIKPDDNRLEIFNYNEDLYVKNPDRLSDFLFLMTKVVLFTYKNRLLKINLLRTKRSLFFLKISLPRMVRIEFSVGEYIA